MKDLKINRAKLPLDQLSDLACYVLITCSAPNEKGDMEVELKFEGDEHLAELLIENASQVFSERKRCAFNS